MPSRAASGEHLLENGFAFLNPYGLPYLPGSGVKGVLRQAAREVDKKSWAVEAIIVLFGQDDNNLDAAPEALLPRRTEPS